MSRLVIKRTSQLLNKRKLLPFQSAQVYVDSEVVRRMAKYTPEKTRVLRNSPYAATRFGSGRIVQSTPYARRQYYMIGYRHRVGGPFWFLTMKKSGDLKAILRGVRKITGAVPNG